MLKFGSVSCSHTFIPNNLDIGKRNFNLLFWNGATFGIHFSSDVIIKYDQNDILFDGDHLFRNWIVLDTEEKERFQSEMRLIKNFKKF